MLSRNRRILKIVSLRDRECVAFSTYFTESMAESVFTDAKVQDWKLPHKIADVYNTAMGSKWQAAHDSIAESKYSSQPLLPRGDAPLQLYSLATPNG